MKYVTFDETTVSSFTDQERQDAILEVQAALQLLYKEVQRITAVKALADQKMRETPEYQKLMEEAGVQLASNVEQSDPPVVDAGGLIAGDPLPMFFPGRPGMFR